MIRTRSGFVSLAIFVLLCGGARSASKDPPSPAKTGEHAQPTGTGEQQAGVVSVRRPELLFGAGQCPTGIEIELWPPNHKYVEIDLEDVLGSQITAIEILSITQDEPVDDLGDGHTECDGDGIGTSVARIRSERSGLANGRVYEIEYSAFDGACSGFIHVLVPHDRSGAPAEDDGQLFESNEGCD